MSIEHILMHKAFITPGYEGKILDPYGYSCLKALHNKMIEGNFLYYGTPVEEDNAWKIIAAMLANKDLTPRDEWESPQDEAHRKIAEWKSEAKKKGFIKRLFG